MVAGRGPWSPRGAHGGPPTCGAPTRRPGSPYAGRRATAEGSAVEFTVTETIAATRDEVLRALADPAYYAHLGEVGHGGSGPRTAVGGRGRVRAAHRCPLCLRRHDLGSGRPGGRRRPVRPGSSRPPTTRTPMRGPSWWSPTTTTACCSATAGSPSRTAAPTRRRRRSAVGCGSRCRWWRRSAEQAILRWVHPTPRTRGGGDGRVLRRPPLTADRDGDAPPGRQDPVASCWPASR